MAEIEITLPTVQYGNVKIRATPEEWGTLLDSPHSIGVMTATYVNLFTQGFKVGSAMDVSAPQAPSQGDPVEESQALLDDLLGGVTVVSSADAETTTQSAPWTETVDAPKKPWEDEGW